MILVRTIPKTFVTKRLCFTGVVDKLLIDYVKVFFKILDTFIAVPRSTQPCVPPGSLNRVPASDWLKAGMSLMSGCR